LQAYDRFVRLAEGRAGLVAINGDDRAGRALLAAYLVRRRHFASAAEAVSWLCIARPGAGGEAIAGPAADLLVRLSGSGGAGGGGRRGGRGPSGLLRSLSFVDDIAPTYASHHLHKTVRFSSDVASGGAVGEGCVKTGGVRRTLRRSAMSDPEMGGQRQAMDD
jgi:hypothetical protein